MLYEKYLIEILLSVILMFNVGAYSFLWYKIRRVEEEQSILRESVGELKRIINDVWNSMYGKEQDQTDEGLLVETEERFDDIDRKLEEICEKIDSIDRERKQEHMETKEDIESLITALDKEDDIPIEVSDILSDETEAYK